MNRLCMPYLRYYSTVVKPNIKLLAKLRQETEVSMSKAKDALVKNGNDYERALAWLAEDARISGAKKATKLASRATSEGVISIMTKPMSGTLENKNAYNRSAMIELNCETDFVSRNEVFKSLAAQIATASIELGDSSSRLIQNIPVNRLLETPLPTATGGPDDGHEKTIKECIFEAISKLGENITLRRVAAVSHGISSGYIHGGDATCGKMGGLVVIEPVEVDQRQLDQAVGENLTKIARHVARQVVGMSPSYVSVRDVPSDVLERESNKDEFLSAQVLTMQSDMIKPDQTIAETVAQAGKNAGLSLGAKVADFKRWQVGDEIDQ